MSTRLCALLCETDGAAYSVQVIKSDTRLSSEVREIAGELLRLTDPCGEDGVRKALQSLILVYGVSDAARTSAFWRVYFQSLGDLPFSALVEACQDYADLPDSTHFPKPGQLKSLAAKRAEVIFKAAARAKSAMEDDKRPASRGPAAMPDERFDAIARADRLEREVPMSLRRSTPMSQWPQEYRDKLSRADEIRRAYR